MTISPGLILSGLLEGLSMRFTKFRDSFVVGMMVAVSLSFGTNRSAWAIEAPDAILALWFPLLGKDLASHPKDSIEHAIWLIQRGQFNEAEKILGQTQEQSRLGATGMWVWEHLDRIRDTTVDVIPAYLADSKFNSEPKLRFGDAISKEMRNSLTNQKANNAGFWFRHAFETCLNHVPWEHVNRIVHLVNGQLDSEFAGEMPDVKRRCTEQRPYAVAAASQYLPTFTPYFDGLLNAAALPPEEIDERALAYGRLARIATDRKDVCAEGFFNMLHGDVLAAPGASPLMLGIRGDWSQAVNESLPGAQQIVAKMRSVDFEAANSSYKKAQVQLEACRDGSFAHWVGVRRAYLSYRNGEVDSAKQYEIAAQQAKTHGDSRIAQVAMATAGMLSGSRPLVHTAVNDAVTTGDFGAAMTIRHVAQILGDGLEKSGHDADRAIALLIGAADVLRDAQLPGAASELYLAAAEIFGRNGRVGTQLYFLKEAFNAVSNFSTCNSVVRKQRNCNGISEIITKSSIQTSVATVSNALHSAFTTMITREPRQGSWEKLEITSRADTERTTDVLGDVVVTKGESQAANLKKKAISAQSRNEILIEALSMSTQASQTAKNCQEKVAIQKKIQRLSDDPTLQEQLLAFRTVARCDPGVAQELRKLVRAADPIRQINSAMQANVGESPFEWKMQQMDAVQLIDLMCAAAYYLGEYDLLMQWLTKLSDVPTSFADGTTLTFNKQWYSGLIASTQGKHAESLAMLQELLGHVYLTLNPRVRPLVLSAIIQTEILAGDTTRSFGAYLRWQQEVVNQRQILTGVRPSKPESAELAQLERRVGLGEAMSAQDDQRIRALIQRVPLRNETLDTKLTVDAIGNAIPSDDSLVIYFMGRRYAAAWIREPGKNFVLVNLTDDVDTLIEEINTYSSSVQAAATGWRKDGERLYAKLIAPLGPLTGKRIVIVPGLLMERLPFDALTKGDSLTFGQEKTVVMLPNLLLASKPPAMTDAAAKPLVVGVNGDGLTSAVAEAQAVANSLGTEAFVGPSARFETIGPLLANATVVHFATHASFDLSNPFASRIEMNDSSKPIPGWWLFRQPINARLVALSACETAQVGAGQGELFPSGLFMSPSLAEAFHIAGAQYVVGTLWQVSDGLAKPLMTNFYQELKRSGGDVGLALSNAKRTLIKDGQANAAQLGAFQVSVRSLADLSIQR
jgi:CHAT domain-containing protein